MLVGFVENIVKRVSECGIVLEVDVVVIHDGGIYITVETIPLACTVSTAVRGKCDVHLEVAVSNTGKPFVKGRAGLKLVISADFIITCLPLAVYCRPVDVFVRRKFCVFITGFPFNIFCFNTRFKVSEICLLRCCTFAIIERNRIKDVVYKKPFQTVADAQLVLFIDVFKIFPLCNRNLYVDGNNRRDFSTEFPVRFKVQAG